MLSPKNGQANTSACQNLVFEGLAENAKIQSLEGAELNGRGKTHAAACATPSKESQGQNDD